LDSSGFYRRERGIAGEEAAAEFLSSKGFEILEQNYFAGRNGEIDIIAIKDNLLLFAEVKKRNSQNEFGGALRSINQKKIRSMRKSAEHFLVKNSRYYKKEITCRFDLIAIEGDEIQWIEDIVR